MPSRGLQGALWCWQNLGRPDSTETTSKANLGSSLLPTRVILLPLCCAEEECQRLCAPVCRSGLQGLCHQDGDLLFVFTRRGTAVSSGGRSEWDCESSGCTSAICLSVCLFKCRVAAALVFTFLSMFLISRKRTGARRTLEGASGVCSPGRGGVGAKGEDARKAETLPSVQSFSLPV
ncbi:E3 ubiquitin-protein ligase znrf1 isoform X2 [Erpetoichthys calabaricus]|uniref:E3 ubiquitin-protein ligase znrf1 isoform X2 n=1 Tax=Erpetoichthys calabaricus TaxID=27687 RepID=UPI00223480EC|nr:E3 ubiquitin-protein ligase znrf1 isoform X2 [Erpetoichthys calabaricus]